MQRRQVLTVLAASTLAASLPAWARTQDKTQDQTPTGKIMGSAVKHTKETMARAIDEGWTVLPAAVTGALPYEGKLSAMPKTEGKAATVLFVHGSGGINPQIKAFQRWLAQALGLASFTLDSFQLPDRMTYSSPIPKEDYEKIHALRSSELTAAVERLQTAPWFDGRFVIAGTSEGAVAVARYVKKASAPTEKGRLIFSWSCEDNYHVLAHKTAIADDMPVLNVMSLTDKYFSQANSYLGNPQALGHCGRALAKNRFSSVVLVPEAPHTLLNLPQTHEAVEGFLRDRLLR